MPLMLAHAEYIKLLRSTHDGQVFDRIPAVAERYQGRRLQRPIVSSIIEPEMRFRAQHG